MADAAQRALDELSSADPFTEWDYQQARRHVTEWDEDDDTVSVIVGDIRVAKGLSYCEAEELAGFLRQAIAKAIRQAVAADRAARAGGGT